MENPYNILVEYRKELPGGVHRLKLHFLDWGAYSDGWTARPGRTPEDGWWVQSPARPFGRRRINFMEFAGDSPLYASIKALCTECIEQYLAEVRRTEGIGRDE